MTSTLVPVFFSPSACRDGPVTSALRTERCQAPVVWKQERQRLKTPKSGLSPRILCEPPPATSVCEPCRFLLPLCPCPESTCVDGGQGLSSSCPGCGKRALLKGEQGRGEDGCLESGEQSSSQSSHPPSTGHPSMPFRVAGLCRSEEHSRRPKQAGFCPPCAHTVLSRTSGEV